MNRIFFKYHGRYETRHVDVVGDFNGWQPGKTELFDDDGDNIFDGYADVEVGRYEYQFLVDGSRFEPDVHNPIRSDRDNEKSVVAVSIPSVTEDAVHSKDFIDEYLPDLFYMKLKTRKDVYSGANLILLIKDTPKSISGYTLYSDECYHYFLFKLENDKPIGEFLYYFELLNLDGTKSYFGSKGISQSEWEVDNFHYRGNEDPRLQSPSWVKNSVFYQIFPERFFNGDLKNDPPNSLSPDKMPSSDSFFGGDLEGVIKKIPHLTKLGVNAVYFNPIFESPSPHKYDTADYEKIDPHFGNDEVFSRLSEGLKKAGIRFILDAVFNHTSPSFFAFADIEKHGEKSKYLNWYFVKKFPLMENGVPNYECWWGVPTMPKLNTQNPDVRKYLLNIAKTWITKGSSGWRLDVPEEIPHELWREFRKAVKETDPDAYILAEIWKEASAWLKGDEFDAAMNYPLRESCISFFSRRIKTAEDFSKEIGKLIFETPMQACFSFFNLLSSHDTARFFTVTGKNISKLKLALAFQFTFIGAPCIYYGEEIGMEGKKDPDNRRFMIWNESKWNKEIFALYQHLIRIRLENPLLQEGDFRIIFARDMVIGFERFQKDQKIAIFINNSDKSVQIDVTQIFGNGDFIDISKDHPLKRKKAYTIYENEFVILKKVKDR